MEEIHDKFVHPNFSTVSGCIKEKAERKKAKVTAIKEIRLQINIADDLDSSSENYFLHRL
ncbi:hypothetical protein [uncultured Draconibacterium sp.]|uniref:hypothetical protein n=1 Tax=uncultured Draconibacterium sp. TaxID=1573823 RepID=UPI0029C91A12|nr:hypothetical protein [uncultured Draconibacterium sp.]